MQRGTAHISRFLPKRPRKPAIAEALEPRTLLAGGATLAAGLITITGTDADDVISIRSSGATVDVNVNGVNYPFPGAQVVGVRLQAFAGNDQVDSSGATASDRIIQGTIDLGTGQDTFVLTTGVANGPLDVLGGDDNDSAICAIAANVLIRFDGGAGSDGVFIQGAGGDQVFTVNAGSTIVAQNLRFNFSAMENVDIQDTEGSNTFNVNFLAAGMNVKISSGDGNDSFDLTTSAQAANITIISGAGTDALHLAALFISAVNYLDSTSGNLVGIDSLRMEGTNGENYFRINTGILEYIDRSTLTSTTIDSIRIDGIGKSHFIVFNSINPQGAPMTLLGGSSDDTLGTYDNPFNITFDGGPGFDTAVFNGPTISSTINITQNTITDSTQTLTYSQLEVLTVHGGFGNDTITMTGSSAATFIEGLGGNDFIEIGTGNLDGFKKVVQAQGDDGFDEILINDSLNPDPDTLAVNGTDFSRTGIASITYSAEATYIAAGSGDNVIELTDVRGFGDLSVDAGAGNDLFKLNSASTVSSIVLEGDNGNDTLNYAMAGDVPFLYVGGHGADTINVNAGIYTLNQDAKFSTDSVSMNVAPQGRLVMNSSQHLSALTIQSGGRATLASNGSRALVTNRLTLNGTLDLTNNSFILQSTVASRLQDLATIENLIKAAYGSAPTHWQNPGLTSSAAASDPSRGVGAVLNMTNSANYTTFAGQAVDANSVLVAYTLLGDLNLDRTVSIADFIDLSTNLGSIDGTWAKGDVNFDAQVSIGDFAALASNFGQPFASAAAAPLSTSFQSSLESPVKHLKRHRPLPHHPRPALLFRHRD